MSLKDRITEDMKAAMRAREAEKLTTIRMLLAAVKQKEVDERVVVDDAALIAIVDRLIKQARTRSASSLQPAAWTWPTRSQPNCRFWKPTCRSV